jgi:hypothetical protein
MHETIHDYALTSERRHTSRIPNSRVVTSRGRGSFFTLLLGQATTSRRERIRRTNERTEFGDDMSLGLVEALCVATVAVVVDRLVIRYFEKQQSKCTMTEERTCNGVTVKLSATGETFVEAEAVVERGFARVFANLPNDNQQ